MDSTLSPTEVPLGPEETDNVETTDDSANLSNLQDELKKTEEEISTLKQVLAAKEQHASELKKMLGITPLSQLKSEINKMQSSPAYQNTQAKAKEINQKVTSSEYYKKTSETIKSASQATATAFTSLGSSVSMKFSEMKNSPTFKSFEERVEGVGTSIMAKVSGTNKDQDGATSDVNSPSEPVVTQPYKADDVPM